MPRSVGSTTSRSARLLEGRRPRGDGAVRAHAAGVGARVAVAEALVVLRGAEHRVALAVAGHVEGDLLAFEALLDDDGGAGLAEGAVAERAGERRDGLVDVVADGDPLARGEPVGLHHHAVPDRARVRGRAREVVEARVRRGGDAVARHEVLREDPWSLRGARPRRRGRSRGRPRRRGGRRGPRRGALRGRDHEVDALAEAERDEAGEVVGGDGADGECVGDAGVARGAEHLADEGEAAMRAQSACSRAPDPTTRTRMEGPRLSGGSGGCR